MGSVKCQHCSHLIRYTGPANGTQYVMYGINEWDRLCKTNLPVVSYEDDGTSDYHYLWECPKCGAFLIFNHNWKVEKIFTPCSVDTAENINQQSTDYIMFVDFYADMIDDSNCCGNEILQFGECCTYVCLYDEKMMIYKDRMMTQLLSCYSIYKIKK